jgi:hypothetical protein
VAGLWQCAIVLLTEELLGHLKAPLSDPSRGSVPVGEIYRATRFLTYVKRLRGADLTDEFLASTKRDPGLSTNLIRCAEMREEARRRALAAWAAVSLGLGVEAIERAMREAVESAEG